MRHVVIGAIIAVLVAAPAIPSLAGEGEMSQQEMMEAMMKAATPGEHHEHIKKLVGDWAYDAKAWKHPGAQPDEWSGTRSAEMAFGGRYLIEKVDGSFMGMPFNGMGILTYDNMAGHYTYAWFDNMGTTITMSHGSCGEAGWEMSGTHLVPGMSEPNPFKTVMRMPDDNTAVFEWHEAMPGGEMFKMMEITYKRK